MQFVDNKAKLISFTDLDYKNSKQAYIQISSALALYRIISLFHCGINSENCDYYKMNWYVGLKHRDGLLGLGEWKGGFQIFTEASEIDQLSDQFIRL